ncbi:hypothetical protein NQ314_011660, partial [Rhamnusium bicolor]
MSTVQDKLKRLKAFRQLDITRIIQLEDIAQRALHDPNLHSNLKVRCRGLQNLLDDFEKQQVGIINIVAVAKSPDLLDAEEIFIDNFMTKYHNVKAIHYDFRSLNNSPSNANALRNLLDIFHENLSALATLDYDINNWDFILMNMLLDRLDQNTLTSFEVHYASTSVPTYKEVQEFLLRQCTALESIASPFSKKSRKLENTKSQFSTSPRNSSFTASQSSRISDLFRKTPQQRYELVKRHKFCVNCLATAHLINKCNSLKRCRKCQKSHHTLLHFDTNENTQQNCETALVTNCNPGSSGLNFPKGDTASPINTLTGSKASFLTRTCANNLGLSKFNIALTIQGLDKMSTPAKSGVHCTLSPV